MRSPALMFVVCSVMLCGPATADVPARDDMEGAAAAATPAVLVAPVIRDWQPSPRTWQPYGYRYAYPRAAPAYRSYGNWQSYGRAPGYAPYRPYYNRYATRPWSERSYDWRSAPQYRWAGASRYRTDAPRAWVDRRDWRR